MNGYSSSPSLQMSPFPDHHDPHRCGTAPFVPVADAPRQHSCGSYQDGFNEQGCNKYRPNYPDDLYFETNGCDGMGDCYDNVPPGQPRKYAPPSSVFWPAEGMMPRKVAGPGVNCEANAVQAAPDILDAPQLPTPDMLAGDGASIENFESSGCSGALKTLVWVLVLYALFRLFLTMKL